MSTVILPAMTYGVETWNLTMQQESKLAVAQHSMELSFLNITQKDKIRNGRIRQKNNNIKDIIHIVESMRGKRARNLARMKNGQSKQQSGHRAKERDQEADPGGGREMKSRCLEWNVKAICQQ